MSSPSPIYLAIINIINGKNASVIKDIENWFKRDTATLLNNNDFVYALLIPLKNGFSGMWVAIKEIMKSYNVQEGLPEMCEALEVLYHSGDNEQIIEALSKVIRKNKEIYVASELLGYTYYQMKMWKNAIACFESIIGNEEVYLYFPPITVYWWLAWAYNKTKNFIEEEACCRKIFSIFSDERYVLNNLGYCLYKQKRFDEAIEIFNDLITQKRDLPYAANNKVRTLLAMGQYEKAVSFINSYDGKITKELIKKAHSLKEQKGAISSVKETANIDNELDIEDDGTEEVSKSIELVDLY